MGVAGFVALGRAEEDDEEQAEHVERSERGDEDGESEEHGFVFRSLREQVAAGRLGRKTGQGFVFPGAVVAAPDDTIVQRTEAALVNEAAWLLAEGGATETGIDTAMKLGLNLPRGPFEILAARGTTIRATLAALEAAAPDHLKGRYLPALRVSA